MKCVICKQAETQPGKTTVTLERGNLTLVIKGVPAQVFSNAENLWQHGSDQVVRSARRDPYGPERIADP